MNSLKISGSYAVSSGKEVAESSLTDLSRILPCLEGVVNVYTISPASLHCRLKIKERLVRGTFDLEAEIEKSEDLFSLHFRLNGTLGTAIGSIKVTFAADPGTHMTCITYDGSVEIKGLAAAVSGSAVDETVRKMLDHIVQCLFGNDGSVKQ